MFKRIILILFGLALLSAATARVASAHATLVRSDPAPNSILATAPRQLTLWYDEPVDLTFSSVEVLDRIQARVDNADLAATHDPKQLHLDLKSLPDGTYTVVWKILSSSDGHITRGVFAFGVGTASAPEILPVASGTFASSGSDPISVLARTINLWSILLLVGAFFFREFLLVRSLRQVDAETPSFDQRWRQLAGATLIAAIAAEMIWLGLQSNFVTGAISSEGIAQVLFETRLGILWIVRLVILTLLGFLLLRQRPRISALVSLAGTAVLLWLYFGGLGNDLSVATLGKIASVFVKSWSAGGLFHHLFFFLLPAVVVFIVGAFQEEKTRRFVSGILALSLLLTVSLSGHAAAQGDVSLAVIADWVHLTAVAFWVGGIATMVWVVTWIWRELPLDQRRGWLAWLLPQFSRVALVCVAAIILTGAFASVIQVTSLDALLQTLYGQVLSTKVLFFLLMLPLGAINLIVIERALAKANQASFVGRVFQAFRTVIATEFAFGTIVIGLAAFLTVSPPARSASAISSATSGRSVLLVGNPEPDLKVSLAIAPSIDSARTFDAFVQDTAEQPAGNILRVILEFTWMDKDIGATRVTLDNAGNGHYRTSGNYLPLPGMWRVRVIVRRKGLEDASVVFPVKRQASEQSMFNVLDFLAKMRRSKESWDRQTPAGPLGNTQGLVITSQPRSSLQYPLRNERRDLHE